MNAQTEAEAIEGAMRRVLKAEWSDEGGGYVLTLACGHVFECTEWFLSSRFLCAACLKAQWDAAL